MKEIGKLIELLNEYKKTRVKEYWIEFNIWEEKGELHIIIDDGQDNYSGGTCDTDIAISYIISKKFGFIKWLVENDKISNDGIKPRTDLVKEITIVDYKTGDAIGWKNKYTEVEQLIMYLSIQDEPIRFLCEIIK